MPVATAANLDVPPLPTPVSGEVSPRAMKVSAVIRSTVPLRPATVAQWQAEMSKELGFELKLEVRNVLGRTIEPGPE